MSSLIKIKKNDELIIIENNPNDPNLNFWCNIYQNWENDTFQVFDKYLSKDKVFIDIGGWIGTTCIYGSKKSKKVYVVEADKQSVKDLKYNSSLNSDNIEIIDKAIFNQSNLEIIFGKNLHLKNSKLNDSTSQIYLNKENPTTNDEYKVETITVKDLLLKYNIDPEQISLIKVDIEGSEEHILNDLLELKNIYNLPIYVSFHYTWWSNLDLTRFQLKDLQKQMIIQNPFCSMIL
jgi:FkbM family methyltransferase